MACFELHGTVGAIILPAVNRLPGKSKAHDFGRASGPVEIAAFSNAHGLGRGPIENWIDGLQKVLAQTFLLELPREQIKGRLIAQRLIVLYRRYRPVISSKLFASVLTTFSGYNSQLRSCAVSHLGR